MKFLLLSVSLFLITHRTICQVIPGNSYNGDNAVKKRTVTVTLDNQGNYFIDTKKIDSIHFDSSLIIALKKLPPQKRLDSAVVVINVDNDVNFKKVYHVMQVAKSKAKVIVNMKMD